ncbi:hypothetical protein AC481_04640 [miscellaneous Crenarchaeota group archaeon SMTZ-80]|nr:MAG: hypothetical protein AC481_04640 [miscellaneous Crenarchaeota group archaeon SMTZ-80]
MNIHRMQLPREVIVGQNVLSDTGEMIKTLGFSKRVLIITGPKVISVISKILENSLDKANISSDYELVYESTLEYVKLVEEKIRRYKPKVILGVGGGKDIDVAKLSSARTGIPFISIPSAASHDGIASANTSVKGFEKPYSIKAQVPIAVIADIDIISKSPYRLTASGCGDIIAKYSAVRDWKLAKRMVKEYYGDYASNLALMSAKLVMKSHDDIKNMRVGAIRTVVEALISCGVAMSIAGSSRPCSGSEHMFAHALDLVTPNDALHGEKCGVGTIISVCLQDGNWKMVRKILGEIGAPTSAKDLGVDTKEFIKALVMARKIRPERYTILSHKKLDQKAAKEIAKITSTID